MMFLLFFKFHHYRKSYFGTLKHYRVKTVFFVIAYVIIYYIIEFGKQW